MKKQFDAQEYAEALEKFVIGMEQIHAENSPRIQEVVGTFAAYLRVAAVEAVIYDDVPAEQRGDGSRKMFYDSGDAAKESPYFNRQVMTPGRVLHYTFFPHKGAEPWTEAELSRIEVIVNVLNVFNRRIMTMRMGQFYATHEQDMGMYNLPYVLRRLTEYSAGHVLHEFAACHLNIRRLSFINQEFGRTRGTELMREFLRGLEDMFTDKRECIGRIGGDNFIIVFRKENLEKIVGHISGVSVAQNEEDGTEIVIAAWAGIYLLPEAAEVTDIMDRIMFTSKMAKSTLSEKPIFFDESMMKRFQAGKWVQSMFAQALKKEEFQVYYQPKVTLKEYRLAGAEALCRWLHDGELIMPYRFIPVLEQSTMICRLDFYMLDHVCRDIRRWLDEGREAVRISVNLSRRHFGDRHLLDHIVGIVDRNRVPHEYIEIELTETFAEVNLQELRELLTGLKRQGIRVSVDDFGSGYSSLNLIRQLPWDTLKLDKSFLSSGDESSDKAQMMFGHVIAMAREMGLECITEGVESVEQIRFLKENNCFLAQGYYFDKPLPVEVFEERLKARESALRE